MPATYNNRGFSLLEILLSLTILGVLTASIVSLVNSINHMSKINETRQRMQVIAAKGAAYYRNAGVLPMGLKADGTADLTGTYVPVSSSYLNLEQKYRLDAWGQYFHYYTLRNSAAIPIDNGLFSIPIASKTLINGITVDSKPVAAVIVSRGPNQHYDSGTGPSFTSNKDDLLYPIDLSQAAMERAQEDLKALQSKVAAFEALYQGVDNNGDGRIDESGCVEQGECASGPCLAPVTWNHCPPPDSTYASSIYSDPNCGTATLDRISATQSAYSTCSTSVSCSWGGVPSDTDTTNRVNALFYCLFKLPQNLMYDPWLHVYKWGHSGAFASDKRQFHTFYSLGPNTDTSAGDDDITP